QRLQQLAPAEAARRAGREKYACDHRCSRPGIRMPIRARRRLPSFDRPPVSRKTAGAATGRTLSPPRAAALECRHDTLSEQPLMSLDLRYHAGFRNHVATEALPGALPEGQNSPQRCPYGLYAEQVSGTAFTAPRGHNLRSWLYRIRPSVVQSAYREIAPGQVRTAPFGRATADPNQMRWDPLPLPSTPTDFLAGLFTMAGNGDAGAQ